ncbi:MAG TPA: PadR family transcriptional regulator [Lachnospiraceae bacterium]|nr:PadR family transcriptional regulator [Lachnospiraceae bacterium]
MDCIILGLLLLKRRTIYQLRERIDKGLNMMYSSSMGSIQAAVKKLLNKGYIQYEETVENGKYKKIYDITDGGKRYFFEWVNSPIETYSKNPELAKLYFMGFSIKEKCEENLQKHILQLKKQYDVLNAICKDGENADVPDGNKDIFLYQLAAARYGRDFLEFNIKWYQNFHDEIRKIGNRNV